jgi:type 2A phosphatase activator TIP41
MAAVQPAINSSRPDTTHPSSTPPSTYTHQNFRIQTQKRPILKALPIEHMTNSLGIAPPEMIFGDNFVSITHLPSKFSISFNAFGALDRVDKTGEKRLKVAYSQEWSQSRQESQAGEKIREVVKPFDWSYSTDFRGDVDAQGPQLREDGGKEIPLELLKRPDPILFFDDVILYESELDDNGISMLSVKIRVMPQRLLLLQRFFMRLDDVLLRIRDTRVYVDFTSGEVIREYVEKEEKYQTVKDGLVARSGGRGVEDVAAVLREPEQVSRLLPEVKRVVDSCMLVR